MNTTKNWKKPIFWISLVCVAVIVCVAVCFLTDPVTPEPVTGMEWLRSLEAEDVAAVRFTVAENPLSYTDYTEEEFPEIVEFLRSCDGAPIENDYPRAGDGERKYFYVTMTDGTVHTLVSRETYVTIDGEPYQDCGAWLAQWPEEGRVHVDEVQRMLNSLERERTRGDYLLCSGDGLPERTWIRAGDDWYKLIDDNGVCRAFLSYEGRQFKTEYRYVGPNYILEDTGWREEAFAEEYALPWPLNEKQDPADYEYVETTELEGVRTVTLRYLPDGALLRLTLQEADGWVTDFEVEASDGTKLRYSLLNPSSAGNLMVWFEYLSATGQTESVFGNSGYVEPTREELDAQEERVRLALKEFQAEDSYSLMQTDQGYDPSAVNSTLLIWNSGDNWLRQYSVEVRTESYLQYEGRQYRKYASTTMTEPWTEADLSGEEACRDSWVRQFQWDPESIYCEYFTEDAENEGHTRIRLIVLDDRVYEGYYLIEVVLDDRGQLKEMYSSWVTENGGPTFSSRVTVYYGDSDAVASYIADACREAIGE